MKSKKSLITILVILSVLLLAIFILNKKPQETTEDIAKCIGNNSVLYVQLGCHACETQEKLFGENIKHITKVDCWFEREKCTDIQVTPTWTIKGQKYEGVQSIEQLKNLTNC